MVKGWLEMSTFNVREKLATFAGYERDFRKEQKRKSKHSPAAAPSSAAQEREKEAMRLCSYADVSGKHEFKYYESALKKILNI